MIVWVNGPFGVGKTTLVGALAERWPEAIVCDPEHLGLVLSGWLRPEDRPEDFQRLPHWRRLVVEALAGTARHHGRPLLVPMTLLDPERAAEVLRGLRQAGVATTMVTLLAERDELVGRLRGRGHDPSWAMDRLDEQAEVLAEAAAGRVPWLGDVVRTDGRSPEEVLGAVLGLLPDPLPAAADLWDALPTKRVAAGALIRDRDGRVLLVDPVYKRGWEVPGGMCEQGESPSAAVARELREELGREVPVGGVLVIDHVEAGAGGGRSRIDGVMLVFDGGVLDVDPADLDLPADELGRARFVEPDHLDEYLIPGMASRLRAAISAADVGGPVYRELRPSP